VAVAVVEAKAFYTFDAVENFDPYQRIIRQDMEKARMFAPKADVFALGVCTHVHDPVSSLHDKLVKYASNLRKSG